MTSSGILTYLMLRLLGEVSRGDKGLREGVTVTVNGRLKVVNSSRVTEVLRSNIRWNLHFFFYRFLKWTGV